MPELRHQRLSVAAVFFVHGLMLATWASHIPHVKSELELSDGALGLVLLCLAAGAVGAMLLTGAVAARVGANVVTRWTTIAMAAFLLLPLAAPTIVLLAGALVLFGGALGSMDVAMNAVAAEVEVRFGRPIMSSFHGMFSAGALAGALVAAGLLQAGMTPELQAPAVVAVILLTIWPSLRILPASQSTTEERPRIKLPHGRLLLLGIMAFAVMLAEGSVVDWSATYLRDDLGSTSAVAPLGFGAFSVTMAIGRFTGDRVNRYFGPVNLVRVGAASAAVGLGVGLTIGAPVAVIGGLAIMGFGLANIIPIIFTASAAAGSTPAEGISGAATLGYLGFLAGPPLIGAVAEATNLTSGLAVVVGLVALVAVAAPLIARQPTRRPASK